MIIISSGMQKSGSGWYFNMTNDLLAAAGKQDIRHIREQYHLDSILRYANCQLEKPTLRNLLALMKPHSSGNTFIVKTHCGPTISLRLFMYYGIARGTYIYRDPRDVAVSAYEHGKKIREGGGSHTFADLVTMEDALLFAKKTLYIWSQWITCNHVFLVRYEDLLNDTKKLLMDFAYFFSLTVPEEKIDEIIQNYTPGSISDTKKDILHFNEGKAGRFRTIMNEKQLRLCKEYFGNYLEKMGYPVD